MSKKRNELKVLLLQAREDQETLKEEHDEFVRFSGLEDGQIDDFNVFVTHNFEPSIIDEYDVLFVGGSSDADVIDLEKFPFIKDCKRLLVYCVENNIPVLGSCYGFQLAVEALGGKVEKHEEYSETFGSGMIHLSDEGKKDVLFGDMPSSYRAVAMHKDSATRLPENAILLAYSDNCPYHAFKIKDKPFYASQHHTEIDKPDFIARVRRYQAVYTDSADVLEKIIDETVDTDEVNTIPRKFIDRIVLKD